MESGPDLSILGNISEVVIDKSFASAYFYTDTKIGFLYWKKQVSLDQYKEVFETILEKHSRTPVDYFLSDIRNQGTPSTEKKEWFKEVALRKAIDSGLKKGAVIVDSNPFRQFYMNIILGATNAMGLPFKTFHDMEEAKQWLTD